jgi:endonuclease/exonuclease/phosphatase family metal-dependent hydrolase
MLRVATFNAGLAVGVLPHVTERLPHVIAALAALDVDLLFVQEFWLEQHWRRLCLALQARLPHSLRPPALAEAAQAVCSEDQLLPLMACAQARCQGLRDEALARCVVQHCAPLALTLPTPCLNCIASHPEGSMEDIVGRCLGGTQTSGVQEPASRPRRYSGLMAYGGSFGTGLLSRSPLRDTDVLVFASSVNARGALHARIDLDEGVLHVFAAHLSPGGAEQDPQVDELIAWMNEKAADAPALLLGDLNTTPGSSLFQRLERAGFREPDRADRRGTFSSEGLSSGIVSASSWRLDHVLLRNFPTTSDSQRILDDPLTLEIGGRRQRSTLSDHFGLLARLHQVSLP